MGTKNAATVAQNVYTNALHTMLPQRSFPYIANFADDFLGGADSEETLVRTTNTCVKHTTATRETGYGPYPRTIATLAAVPEEQRATVHPFTHRDGIT